jgi:thioredoxin reductase
VESVLGLANQAGTEVTLSYRGAELSRVKERNREKFDKAVAAGKVQPMFNSHVREIRPDVAVLDRDGEATILPNDYLFIRIGGDAPYKFLERLGVRIVEKDVPMVSSNAKTG